MDDTFANAYRGVSLVSLKHTTPSAGRHVPDQRANVVPCKDFEQFRGCIDTVERFLPVGERKARPVRTWSVLEPIKGDLCIRNGSLRNLK
ncbi:hypothetical protein J4E08_00230 [Sagittula sp. NFXS13]|uniref:hypothetical protein n=1 Tax=Sagittula sp. NFXS13 TaxID=2819095 RepID=UPI0032DF7D79